VNKLEEESEEGSVIVETRDVKEITRYGGSNILLIKSMNP
jgi:hypothetical protein